MIVNDFKINILQRLRRTTSMVSSNKTKHKSFTTGRLFSQDNVLSHLDFYFPVISNVKLKRAFLYYSRTAVSYFIFASTFAKYLSKVHSEDKCSTHYCFVSLDVTKIYPRISQETSTGRKKLIFVLDFPSILYQFQTYCIIIVIIRVPYVLSYRHRRFLKTEPRRRSYSCLSLAVPLNFSNRSVRRFLRKKIYLWFIYCLLSLPR